MRELTQLSLPSLDFLKISARANAALESGSETLIQAKERHTRGRRRATTCSLSACDSVGEVEDGVRARARRMAASTAVESIPHLYLVTGVRGSGIETPLPAARRFPRGRRATDSRRRAGEARQAAGRETRSTPTPSSPPVPSGLGGTCAKVEKKIE